jgi:hypothetical protein
LVRQLILAGLKSAQQLSGHKSRWLSRPLLQFQPQQLLLLELFLSLAFQGVSCLFQASLSRLQTFFQAQVLSKKKEIKSVKCGVVNPDPHPYPHHFGNLDSHPDPHQIKIRIRKKVISWIRNRTRKNLQMTS